MKKIILPKGLIEEMWLSGERTMKDHLERMEDAAEKRLAEQTKGCLPGYFVCGCGNVEHLNNAQPYSASPFSEPICLDCWKEWSKKYEGE